MRIPSPHSTLGLWAVFLLCLLPGSKLVGQEPDTLASIFDLDLEALMAVQVTSVSKRAESLFGASAAVQVISDTDIRRSGATSIPEVLRLVPGIQMNRFSASEFAVTARGFGDVFGNKMLILIDGRSLYSPLFSGVRWQEHQLVLEDVDRIEVVRGPGATLWGANAVNGVINIVTKTAEKTQGVLATATYARGDLSQVVARVGGKGLGAHWRTYAKLMSHEGYVDSLGADFPDDWHGSQGGFRAEWKASQSRFTLHGDLAQIDFGAVQDLAFFQPPFLRRDTLRENQVAWNLHGEWSYEVSDRTTLFSRVYYHHTDRDLPGGILSEHRELDVEAQHTLLMGRHELVWGLQVRRYEENLFGNENWNMVPPERTDFLFGAFVQDRLQLGDGIFLTFGSKIEHNDYTGVEIQPGIRASWQPTPNQTLWGSVTRALRTPSRTDHDIRFLGQVYPAPGGLLAHVYILGDRAQVGEDVLSHELGYRAQIGAVSLDVATFFNRYDHLRSLQLGSMSLEDGPEGPYMLVPLTHLGLGEAEVIGAEVSGKWTVSSEWQLEAGYTRQRIELDFPASHPLRDAEAGTRSPENQFHLRSMLNLGPDMELDAWFRHTGPIPYEGASMPAYSAADLRLGWAPTSEFRIDVGGKDLLEGAHREFPTDSGYNIGSYMDRSWYAKVTWAF